MKNIMKTVAAILGGFFAVAIFGLMVSLTFTVLGRLFPDSYLNQAWGLILFDLAALVWFITFLAKSEGSGQRAVALLLFVASLLGTLAMVSSEVLLAGQEFVEVSPTVGRVVVYSFILMTAIHLTGIYAHHAMAPGVIESIQTQNMKDELTAQARVEAEGRFTARKIELGAILADDIERRVLNDLALPIPDRLAGRLTDRKNGSKAPAPAALLPYNSETEAPPLAGSDRPGK